MSTLVVLAAGLASRYGGDKQLEHVGPAGELLLEYALYDGWRAGCRQAVLVIREALRAAFEAELLPAWRDRLPITLAVQRLDDTPVRVAPSRLKPWGTAHAVYAARAHVTGDLLVCNADDFYGAAAFRALADQLATGREHALAGYPLAATLSPHGGVSRALCRTGPDGLLSAIEERTGIRRTAAGRIRDDRGALLAPDAPVSMNLWAFRAPFLQAIEHALAAFLRAHAADASAELRIPDVVSARLEGNPVRVVPAGGDWFGMTYAADRAAVRAALAARTAAGDYPARLRGD